MTDYRTRLRARNIHPLHIERTIKQAGDLVLMRVDQPAIVWGLGAGRVDEIREMGK